MLSIPNISTPSFQFHKGTIKTGGAPAEGATIREFQFHKGTIKTQFFTLIINSDPNFNSIKVRLKPYLSLHKDRTTTNFNSIKVRLKLS